MMRPLRARVFLSKSVFAALCLTSLYSCMGPSKADNRKGGNSSAGCLKVTETNLVASEFKLLAGPYYSPDVKTIMDGKCATSGCHNAGAMGAALPLSNYTQVKNQASDIIDRIQRTGGGKMPPTGAALTAAEINTIKSWSSGGLLENSQSNPSPTPTPAASTTPTTTASFVDFNTQVKPLMVSKCGGAGCHGTAFADVTDYSYAKQDIDNIIARMSVAGSTVMPPASRGGKVSDAELKIVTDWKAGGLIEDASASSGGTGSTTAPNSSNSNSGCSSATSRNSGQEPALDALMHPPGMQACASSKQAYSRKSNACVANSTLISEACDKAWVEGKITQIPEDKKQEIEGMLDGGWSPEQCSTVGSDVLFYLVKVDTSSGTPKLESKGYQVPQ